MRDGVIESGGTWREECGVFGIFGHPQAAELTQLALIALQHRGQESAGIATMDGREMHHHRGMGLVADAIPDTALARLAGDRAIGHVRYSTTGASELQNAQPLVFGFQGRRLALAHNGNLISAHLVRARLEREGAIFQTTSDTEVVAHLVARSTADTMVEQVVDALSQVLGAYGFCVLTDDLLVAARDPNALRPLAVGRLGDAWCVASESCAFDAIGATLVRDLGPGELVAIERDSVTSHRVGRPGKRALCTFEHIYFARPDSDIDGYNVHMVRKEFGRQLAREHAVDADVVIGVPDSSISSAIGYAEQAGLPYEIGLIKNRYIGRTFIQPSQELRTRAVRLKLSVVRRIVAGQRVVMVDDSLVRGTTSGRIVRLLRDAGAREVHVRIASPPVTDPCFYGIDTSHRSELIAATHDLEGIRTHIGADTLAFLSEPAMMEAFGVARGDEHGFCNACFTGRYPTERFGEPTKAVMEAVTRTPVLEPA